VRLEKICMDSKVLSLSWRGRTLCEEELLQAWVTGGLWNAKLDSVREIPSQKPFKGSLSLIVLLSGELELRCKATDCDLGDFLMSFSELDCGLFKVFASDRALSLAKVELEG